MKLEEKQTEYHLPFHNYAGPGTKIATNIFNNKIPVNSLDAAALVHDLEYLRDKDRDHADNHMYENLSRNSSSIAKVTNAIFKIDKYILRSNRTDGKKREYDFLKPKAEHLLSKYPNIKFDEPKTNEPNLTN